MLFLFVLCSIVFFCVFLCFFVFGCVQQGDEGSCVGGFAFVFAGGG